MPNITATVSEMSLKSFEIFLSVKGSISAEQIRSIICITAIFIMGTEHMEKRVKIPAPPTAFFIIELAEITVSNVSERNLPTTGTRLPMANLAVFEPMISRAGAANPYIPQIPVKIVKTAVRIHFETEVTSRQNPLICIRSLKLFATESTAE